MKLIKLSILVFLLLQVQLQAQISRPIEEILTEIKRDLSIYEQLNPFGEDYIRLSELGLSDKYQKLLMKEAKELDEFNIRGDSIAVFYLLEAFQWNIENNIKALVTHNDFNKVNVLEALESPELNIIKSEDGKLYNFSIDEKSTGTYRSRISIMHYTGLPAKQDTLKSNTENLDPYSIFSPDGYDAIYDIVTTEGTKYLLTGSVRGCSYCFETNVLLVHYIDGFFQPDFSYAVNTRNWEGGVYYDPESKSIRVDYTTDDLTTNCDCSNQSASEEVKHSEEELKPKHCNCIFEFNGNNFELTKECWEDAKE